MGVRRSSIVFATAFSAAALWAAGPGASLAGAQPAGGVCQLQGVANISPPLTGTSQSFAYNFTGMLGTGAMGSCQSNLAGAPTMGTVSAGIQLQETVTLTNTRPGVCTNGFCDDRITACTSSSQCPPVVTTIQGPVLYQEPIPQGSGSCGSSTTAGMALVVWNDGKNTVIASMTLTLVASSVPAGYTAPPTYVINSDESAFPVGEQSLALLTFSPTTPDQNCETVGVSSADINGVVGVGRAP